MKGEIPSQPRNFVVSTPKKGGFGFNKNTLSEKQGYKGVVGFSYLPETAFNLEELEGLARHSKALDAPS
jgi:hypothetical protein